MVAHAQQLAEADNLLLGLDGVLLHHFDGVSDRILVVGRNHYPDTPFHVALDKDVYLIKIA